MPTSLTCPHCRQQFELSDINKDELESKLRQQLSVEFQKKTNAEIQLLKEENARKEKELQFAQKHELELLKRQKIIEEREKNLELEKERQLAIDREQISQKLTGDLTEQFRLKEKEFQKKISDMQSSMDEMQRKALQGSQQLQGEIQELDLKDKLSKEFPDDQIEDVEKGIRGADLRQIVRSSRGFVCGTILWESKRTKDWSDSWISKLKSDLLLSKSDIPIIVSTVLPKDFSGELGFLDGVWITLPKHSLALAFALRSKLHDLAKQKYFTDNQGSKAELVYGYVTGNEFTQHVQALVEVYQESLLQINQEKAAFERIWKKREGQAQRIVSSTMRIYGSLQGIAGAALPTVKGLELPESI